MKAPAIVPDHFQVPTTVKTDGCRTGAAADHLVASGDRASQVTDSVGDLVLQGLPDQAAGAGVDSDEMLVDGQMEACRQGSPSCACCGTADRRAGPADTPR